MVSATSRIEQVTVYASGARVRRVATVTPGSVVRLGGLPLALIDDTVRVEIIGPAVATAVRTTLEAPAAEAAAREDSAELRAARRHVALVEAEVERLDAAIAAQASAAVIEPDPSDDPPAAWSSIVAARRGLVALRTQRELHLRDQHGKAVHEAAEATAVLAAITDRELRAGTARTPKLHELRKEVELELAAGSPGEGPVDSIEIHLEYQVAAARWAPSYVARLEGDQVRFELRAVVAQDSGEDWLGASLRLSTAEPERFSTLPELAAQRIGRRQEAPARSGFRAPPAGADQLYADYRAAFPSAALEDQVAPRDEPETELDGAPAGFAQEVWDEDSSLAKRAFKTPPRGSPMPVMFQQHQPQAQAKGGGLISSLLSSAGSIMPKSAPMPNPMAPGGRMRFGGGAAALPQQAAGAPVPRLDYAGLRMAPPSSGERGQLVLAPRDGRTSVVAQEAAATAARLADLALPRGCSAAWAHTYDYAFASDGTVDVRADGAWHSLALTTRATTAKLGYVTVPREQADVFRVAGIPNPFAGPLLPGPIDVYDRGQFLLTSEVDYTPPGATVEIGLGVDAAVKVARNAEFREEVGGMLRGALRLVHAITIDVENLSGRAIEVEVRERVPVIHEREDDIEVTIGKVEPEWERWTPDPAAPEELRLRGAHMWRLALPAGAKRTLRAGYEIKIATKHELVGGNRREP